MDRFNLQRFVEAQDEIYSQVERELGAGRKTSHWMWFVFPQIAGLGHSPTAKRFAITSLNEARAYLEHPTLGTRLRQCTRLVNRIEGSTILDIFGFPDDRKFHSSMTLFAQATADDAIFMEALRKFFKSELDAQTLSRL